MSFFFLDEWSIKKITVLFLTRNEDHQKIKKIFVLWRMYILKKWNVVSYYLSGQKNFCSTNSTDFQIDWIFTVFDVHLHQQKTVATKQIFKNNFFFTKVRFSFNESNDDCDVIGLFPWCIWNIWNVGKEKMWAKR